MTLPLTYALVERARSPQPMTDASQVGAWMVAARDGDTPLMVALVARPDLCDQVESLAASCADLVVRACLLARTDTTAERVTRTLGPRPTSSDLAVLCRQSATLPEPVLAVLRARLTERPTSVLARAVLDSSLADVPLVLAALLRALADGSCEAAVDPERLHAAATLLAGSAEAAPMAAAAIVARTPSVPGWASPLLASDHLDGAARAALVHAIVGPTIAQAAVSSPYAVAARGTAMAAALASRGERLEPEAEAAWELALSPYGSMGAVGRLLAIVSTRDPAGTTPPSRPSALADAGKVADVSGVYDFVRDHHGDTDFVEAVAALVERADLTGPRRIEMMAHLCARLSLRDDSAAGFDAAMTRLRGDLDFANALYSLEISVREVDNFAAYPVPADGPVELIRYIATASELTSWNILGLLDALGDLLPGDSDLWTHVPWSAVSDILTARWSSLRDAAIMAVVRMQEESFTAPEQWDAMAVLSTSFTGTLGDLVAASAAL